MGQKEAGQAGAGQLWGQKGHFGPFYPLLPLKNDTFQALWARHCIPVGQVGPKGMWSDGSQLTWPRRRQCRPVLGSYWAERVVLGRFTPFRRL